MAQISKSQQILGFLLILIGLVLLIGSEDVFSWDYVRSYFFLILGLWGIIKVYLTRVPRGIYIYAFLFLLGFYFTLHQLGFYEVDRGATLTAITLALGIAFYPLYFLKEKRMEYILYGNIFILVGLFFLLLYVDILPPHLFVTIFDTYWPVLLILLGFGLLIKSIKSRMSSS